MAQLVVHAGDFSKGTGTVGSAAILMPPEKLWQQWGEKVPLSEVAEVDLASEESVKRIGGTVGWGLAGAAILGPVGLLAGLLLGGRGTDRTFVCRLKDGRKFLATADAATYTKLQSEAWAAA